jgi:hypothetical protein
MIQILTKGSSTFAICYSARFGNNGIGAKNASSQGCSPRFGNNGI